MNKRFDAMLAQKTATRAELRPILDTLLPALEMIDRLDKADVTRHLKAYGSMPFAPHDVMKDLLKRRLRTIELAELHAKEAR